MKTVNVRQLKKNPSAVLRIARKHPVVVINRDQPEAVLFHLDDEGLLGEPGVRLALATVLYKSESVSLGRAAKIAGVPLEAFMVEMGRAGIPVIRGTARTLREDLRNTKAQKSRRGDFKRMLGELAVAGRKMSESEALVSEAVAESRRQARTAPSVMPARARAIAGSTASPALRQSRKSFRRGR